MAINYVPGDEAILGPAFTQLADKLADFINPSRKFSNAVMAGISNNPKLLQEFADIGATNPELLHSLGLGKLAQVPASAEAEFQAMNRPEIVQLKTDQLGLERDKIGLNKSVMGAATKLISDPNVDPKFKADLGRRFLQMDDTDTAKITEETAKQATLTTAQKEREGTIKAAQMPAELAEAELAARSGAAALSFLKSGTGVDFEKFVNEEYTPDELLGMFRIPEFKEALQYQLQNNIALLRNEYSETGDDVSLKRVNLTYALKKMQDLNVPAPVQVYLKYTTGDGVDIAQAAMKKPEAQRSEEEKQLIEIYKREIALGEDEKQKQKLIALDKVKMHYAAYMSTLAKNQSAEVRGEGGEGGRMMTINSMNEALREAARYGKGEPYKVEYRPFKEDAGSSWYNRWVDQDRVFKFVDANGKEVTYEQVISGNDNIRTTPPPDTTKSKTDTTKAAPALSDAEVAAVQAAIDKFKTPGEREAAKAKLISQATPEQAKILRARLK